MDSVAAFLDKRFIATFDPWKDPYLEDFDVLMAGWRTRYIGFILEHDAIMVDWKRLASFRIRISNLGNALPRMYVAKVDRTILNAPYEREQMRQYYLANEDNPFAVWHSLQSLGQLPELDELTQFPPLMYPKTNQRTSLAAMRDKIEVGDLLFTYDRGSGLARLIRRWDWSMWSHCAMCGEDGHVYEATTAGLVKSSFDRFYADSLDVGLYRLRRPLTSGQKENMLEFMDVTQRQSRKGYPWRRVVKIGLQKKFGIPYRRSAIECTCSDLMHSNQLQLVCYA